MKKNNTPKSFEQAMEELDAIVTRMENGELPLEDMLIAYRRGVELSRFCRDKLEKAQQEIKKLDNGELADFTGAGE